jgi:hypothetical protein
MYLSFGRGDVGRNTFWSLNTIEGIATPRIVRKIGGLGRIVRHRRPATIFLDKALVIMGLAYLYLIQN